MADSPVNNIEALIDDRIRNLETFIVNEQKRSLVNIAIAQEKIGALTRLKGTITDRDIALYRMLKDEGILSQLTQ